MKSIPLALQPQYASSGSTLAMCLLVARSDGVSIGFNSSSRTLTFGGIDYIPGLDISDIVSSSDNSTDNLEITIYPDADIPDADLLAGKWDNAAMTMFECNWKAPADGINPMKFGTSGEVQLTGNSFVLEFRGLTQFLQQAVGMITSQTCRAHFADFPRQALGARCGLAVAAYTHTGTITSVTSPQVFTDNARTEATDTFTAGYFVFTSGANAGVAFAKKAKAFLTGGVFTMSLPFPYAVAVGDAYTAIEGCQHRFEEDCIARFNNGINFQGEPHVQGQDALLAPPEGLS